MLVACRGMYLLSLVHEIMQVPGSANLLHFEDLTQKQVRNLHGLIVHLIRGGPAGSNGYLVEAEASLALQKRGDGTEEEGNVTWDEMWCNIFRKALTEASKAESKADKDKDKDKSDAANADDGAGRQVSGAKLAKYLPKAANACPKKFMEPKDKDKTNEQTASAATASESNTAATDSTSFPSFSDIYKMHNMGDKVSDINVVNIVALQGQIEAHVMSNAVKKSNTKLLDAIHVDSKNAAVINIKDMEACATLKDPEIFACGSVSTEWCQRAVKVSWRDGDMTTKFKFKGK